jgi:hypothetical protein
MKLRVFACLAIAGLLCTASINAQYVDKRLRKGGFGAKVGFLAPTTASVDGRQYSTQFGMSGGIFFDKPLSRRIMLGLSVDLYNFIFKGLEDNEPYLDINIGSKYVIVAQSSDIALMPGFSIGFGYLGPIGPYRDSVDYAKRYRVDRTAYMTWQLDLDVLFLTRRQYALITEFAVFGTAFGRNSEVELTTNPTILLRVGFMY